MITYLLHCPVTNESCLKLHSHVPFSSCLPSTLSTYPRPLFSPNLHMYPSFKDLLEATFFIPPPRVPCHLFPLPLLLHLLPKYSVFHFPYSPPLPLLCQRPLSLLLLLGGITDLFICGFPHTHPPHSYP